jgi:hypothetical protein
VQKSSYFLLKDNFIFPTWCLFHSLAISSTLCLYDANIQHFFESFIRCGVTQKVRESRWSKYFVGHAHFQFTLHTYMLFHLLNELFDFSLARFSTLSSFSSSSSCGIEKFTSTFHTWHKYLVELFSVSLSCELHSSLSLMGQFWNFFIRSFLLEKVKSYKSYQVHCSLRLSFAL